MTRKTRPTSSQICSQRTPAQHPAEAAQAIIDQIPQFWESVAQLAAVKRVIKTALPPPRPDEILRSATILRVARVINKDCHRLVWRYIAANRSKFGKFKKKPNETEFPIYFTMYRRYSEARKYRQHGIESVRLITKLARKLAPKTTFSGEMYYRHVLALRDTTISYRKQAKAGKVDD